LFEKFSCHFEKSNNEQNEVFTKLFQRSCSVSEILNTFTNGKAVIFEIFLGQPLPLLPRQRLCSGSCSGCNTGRGAACRAPARCPDGFVTETHPSSALASLAPASLPRHHQLWLLWRPHLSPGIISSGFFGARISPPASSALASLAPASLPRHHQLWLRWRPHLSPGIISSDGFI
jgi:hypothetical protein